MLMRPVTLLAAALAVSAAPACTSEPGPPAGGAKPTEPPAVERSALLDADRISVSGRVTESDAQRVVVATATGEPVGVRVDRATTRVEVNGVPASAVDLAPGTEVRVLYRLVGAQLIAERIDAER
ncbi:MAG TPA: hypothetical protein VFU21_24455 [Kofleriaceae bacterium]|nr:hypothetical protein [Kofleriaceae bacterium]